MIASISTTPRHKTIADLLHELGDVPADRVLLAPTPGAATEQDLLALLEHEGRTCELVDGTLVEKPVGTIESFLAAILIRILGNFTSAKKLGMISGEQGPYRLRLGLVRLPDVAFISWSRIPGELKDLPSIAPVVPNLAIEVLSESNTKPEIERKLGEYFTSGVQLVWIFDPRTRAVAVHLSAGPPTKVLTGDANLDGGTVLPGFQLNLAALFTELERPAAPEPDGHRA
jgi:Uma2 family endonuclease